MPLILDATPGGASANAYATLVEATTYHEAHVYGAPWLTLSEDAQTIALVHATRLLDEHVQWQGVKTNQSQALSWPRTGVPEKESTGAYAYLYGTGVIDSTIIPLWLKNATAEFARHLTISDRTAESEILEYSSLSVGSLSLTKDPTKQKEVVPPSVWAMVQWYGVVQMKSGIQFAKMVRA